MLPQIISDAVIALSNYPVYYRPSRMFYLVFIVSFADIRQSRSQIRERTGNNLQCSWEISDPVRDRVLALMRENHQVKMA